jgi:hypothetical protein
VNTADARRAMDELAYARDKGLLNPLEVHTRTTAILDRTELRPLDLVEFLREKGHTEFELFRLIGEFGKAVKRRYAEVHGHEPLQRLGDAGGRARPVYAYVDDDLPLIEDVYASMTTTTANAI